MGGFSIPMKHNDGIDISTSRIHVNFLDFLKIAKLHHLEFPPKAELMDRSKADWISKSITSMQITWFVCQLIGRAVQKLPVTTLELFTCALVACTLVTYVAWWNKPLDIQRPIVLDCEVTAAFLAFHNISSLKTASSLSDSLYFPQGYNPTLTQTGLSLILTILAFTAPHLLGWNFHFPTRTEQWLWRVAAVLCAGLPIAVLFCTGLAESLGGNRQKRLWTGLAWPCTGSYFLVRACLLIEVFVGLRSVPVGVYTAANWSAYIPHI